MTDDSSPTETNPIETSQADCPGAKGSEGKVVTKRGPVVATWTPITTRGQKYVGPAGRHSQQTHQRARERAEAGGHTSEKQLHAHNRGVVEAELKWRSDLRLQQQQASIKK